MASSIAPTTFGKSFFQISYNFGYFIYCSTIIRKYWFKLIHWKLIRIKSVSLDLAIGKIYKSLSAYVKVWHSFKDKLYWDHKFSFLSPDMCSLKITNLHRESENTKTKKVRLLLISISTVLCFLKMQIFHLFQRFVIFKKTSSHYT